MGINVISSRCQKWRFNRAECSLCSDACPVCDCIRFNEDRTIHINTETCIFCGVCSAVCPSDAINIDGLNGLDLWDRLRSSGKNLFFACIHRNNPTESAFLETTTLPCLCVLDESYLSALILTGTEKIYLDTGSCGECRIKKGLGIIKKNIYYARSLLSAIGHHGMIITGMPEAQASRNKGSGINTRNISAGRSYSRRELLSNLIGRRIDKPVSGAEQPEKRKILLDALSGHIKDCLAVISGGEFPAHQLTINENCSLCHSCELFCPTGALKRVENDREVRIDFRASQCTGCFQCRELCMRGAIQYSEYVSLNDLMIDKTEALAARPKIRCRVCGKLFIDGGSDRHCLKCIKRAHVEKEIISILTMKGGAEEGSFVKFNNHLLN